jgi:hypothetical protein
VNINPQCCVVATLLLSAAAAGSARAQSLPTGPVSAFEGRVSIGAEVIATIGEEDETAFFNYTDYEHNTLRMFRVGLSAEWRALERVNLVAEIRSEDLDAVRPYAAYVRVRPWRSVAFDVQAGRIPPTFGSFGRRTYAFDNPLIGYPLAHQYLTSLRPDAIPNTVDDLLFMRGRGWQVTYPAGSPEPAPGLPILSAFRWDTGVQAHWRGKRLDATGAITNGTLSDPQVGDNNSGKQFSGRIAARPVAGLVIGGSASHGEWLDRSVTALVPQSPGTFVQRALGADFEYSRDYWIVRTEVVWSRWTLPFAATGTYDDVDALAMWIEGRYRITPRIFLAARADTLGFSKIADSSGRLVDWDAEVARFEVDAGYYVQRNLMLRLAVQHNDRDGGRVLKKTFVSGQVAYWF